MASKYRNVKTVVDGITFASKREAAAYQALRLLERAGRISHIRTQVTYNLVVKKKVVTRYIADFVYWDKELKVTVVADAKGFKTPVYKLKKKLMKVLLDIDVVEI
jgi:hypothetical protein